MQVDLWDLLGKPPASSESRVWRIQSMTLGSDGGGAAFDRILLGRTEKDLPK
jgi:hypothetical protein